MSIILLVFLGARSLVSRHRATATRRRGYDKGMALLQEGTRFGTGTLVTMKVNRTRIQDDPTL